MKFKELCNKCIVLDVSEIRVNNPYHIQDHAVCDVVVSHDES